MALLAFIQSQPLLFSFLSLFRVSSLLNLFSLSTSSCNFLCLCCFFGICYTFTFLVPYTYVSLQCVSCWEGNFTHFTWKLNACLMLHSHVFAKTLFAFFHLSTQL